MSRASLVLWLVQLAASAALVAGLGIALGPGGIVAGLAALVLLVALLVDDPTR